MEEILVLRINFSQFQDILDVIYFNNMFKTQPGIEATM